MTLTEFAKELGVDPLTFAQKLEEFLDAELDDLEGDNYDLGYEDGKAEGASEEYQKLSYQIEQLEVQVDREYDNGYEDARGALLEALQDFMKAHFG